MPRDDTSAGETPAIAVPTGRATARPSGPAIDVAIGLDEATPPSPAIERPANEARIVCT